MIEPAIIAETDPRVLLPVNPQAAITEAFSALERRVRQLALMHGYPTAKEAEGMSAAQYLNNIGAISSGTLKIWQILKNVRDQAVHIRNGVDLDSGRRYLALVEPEQRRLKELISHSQRPPLIN
jgi:hypothetical protein